ncbi:putative reverse transcriptase domain-containing protein [Tanacetum coccineum]
MPPKSAPLTQAAIRRMIKESVDAAIAAERARHANVGNDARGSGPARGQDAAPAVRECTFAGFMKCNPTAFHGTEGAVELLRWFEKTESVFGISECAEGKKVKFAAATLQGPALTWWNAKIATMGLETVNQMPWTEMKQLMTAEFCPIEEVQRMEHELWNLKVKEYNIVAYTQRFNELALMCPRMVEPERVKVDAYIRGLTDNIKGEVTSSKPANLNEAINQKQGNARAMVTAPTDGKLPLCERCFTRHGGQCTIKCHKCGKVGHKIMYCKEKNVAMGANALPILTCDDCGEQGSLEDIPRRVPYDQRNNPPQNPRIVYLPILNINYFRHFIDILQNYDLMDDEPMWAADHVVASTQGSAITIPETANEFAIKGNHLTLVKGSQFDGRTKTDLHKHIHEFLRICDMFKYRDTENEVVRLMMFPLSLTREAKTWLEKLNEGTIETWDEL